MPIYLLGMVLMNMYFVASKLDLSIKFYTYFKSAAKLAVKLTVEVWNGNEGVVGRSRT